MRVASPASLAAALTGIVLIACSDNIDPARIDPVQETSETRRVAAPAGVVALTVAGATIHLWPYLGEDLGATPADPVSLIFTGQADPRSIRAGLLALDGNRSAFGFPAVAPFDCRWSDAIGGVQGSYTTGAGWSGSAIQLQCGDYGPVRFHLRLFRHRGVTLGGAHFEILIPGTTDHQVISWELAEQLVAADLARSGLLSAPPAATQPLNASPFREIPAVIYNGMPEELKQVIGGPAGAVSAGVPIGTDGRATMLSLAREAPVEAGVFVQDFVLTFGQVIPKPFCASGPGDFIYVAGPVHLRQRVSVTADGDLRNTFDADGRLQVTPVDPSISPPAPIGAPFEAQVSERQQASVRDDASAASSLQQQFLLSPSGSDLGRLQIRLQIGPPGGPHYDRQVRCAP